MLDALLFVALSQNGGFVKLNMIQYLKRRFVGHVREVETYHRNHTDQKGFEDVFRSVYKELHADRETGC